ncbi:MAG: alkaline phosphatase family protein [Alphaproteobacteria bacterium]
MNGRQRAADDERDVRVVTIILDGFRRDFLDKELVPNLWALSRAGSDFPLSRAVFPSATRVNASAIATGTLPGANGLVANRFFDANVFTDRLIDTSRVDHLRAIGAAYDGQLLTSPTLGEALASAGKQLAVVTNGSEGTTFLINPRAGELAHATLCVKEWHTSTPQALADDALEKLGEIPPLTRPNTRRSRYLTDLFLEVIEPRLRPEATILWYNDPDVTMHRHGLGSPECLAALRDLDDEIGRLVAWRRDSGQSDTVQFIVGSDHGHVTGVDPVDVHARFAAAGFPIDTRSDTGSRFVGSLGYCGSITEMAREKTGLPVLAEWLMTQNWCGCIFTRGGDGTEGHIPGTFSMSLLGAEHPRLPDLIFCMAGDDTPNNRGLPGSAYSDGSQAVGGGVHGGLNPRELANLLVFEGSCFQRGFTSSMHAGDIDIAPTVLGLLGLQPPSEMRGRVLVEALSCGGAVPNEVIDEVSVSRGNRRQILRFARIGEGLYLDGGFVEMN